MVSETENDDDINMNKIPFKYRSRNNISSPSSSLRNHEPSRSLRKVRVVERSSLDNSREYIRNFNAHYSHQVRAVNQPIVTLEMYQH